MQGNKFELTSILARFIVETDVSDIPFTVFEHAKIAFQDWFAVTMAGKDEQLVLKLIHFSDLMGGKEQATILGHGIKKNASLAALINGSASHALDYDDTIFFGDVPVHPSATLFPALLSLSEWQEKAGLDFLAAYLIGFKVGACLAMCAGAEHYSAGWHATSTIGRLASAAGCAKLMELNEQQTVYALGIAGTLASGLKGAFGSMCKAFHAGRASQDGLEAALLAMDGFTSAKDILEGPAGFFQLLKGEVKEEAVNSLGKTWEIERLAQKYHASGH
jgi:2-methylcitrate dehydratase PrpD